ncbi:MAG: DsbC family protein [Gammaproteobacteria bacterium]|nr:DsbC family protein [Gammaproteobacteria bacterium]
MNKFYAIPALFAFTQTFADEAVDLSLLKETLGPSIVVKNSKPSPIPGLYQVQINSQIIYITADGEKIISGDIYDLKQKFSLTANAQQKIVKDEMSKVSDSDKIIYKAKDEKYKISVFTDITCPYCTKMHNHMKEYNDLGITVEYLAYPRSGIGSDNAKNMQKIWCAENKTIAMNEAKSNHKIPTKKCDGNQVMDQFLLGNDIGVNATPTVVFENGEISPGYATPAELINQLKNMSK